MRRDSPFIPSTFLQDEDACSNGSVTSVPDHKVYFQEHVGAFCGYPPGTFPPPERLARTREEAGGEGSTATAVA